MFHKTSECTEGHGGSLSTTLQKTKVASPFLGLSSQSSCLAFSPLPLSPPSPSSPPPLLPFLVFFLLHIHLSLISHPVSSYLLEILLFSCSGKLSSHVGTVETTGRFAKHTTKKEDRTQCFKSGTRCCFLNNYLILSPGGIYGQEQFWTNFSGTIKAIFSFHHPRHIHRKLNFLKAKPQSFKFMYYWY